MATESTVSEKSTPSISLIDSRISMRSFESLRHVAACELSGFITLAIYFPRMQCVLPIVATTSCSGVSILSMHTLRR